jgi:hypothetical protein
VLEDPVAVVVGALGGHVLMDVEPFAGEREERVRPAVGPVLVLRIHAHHGAALSVRVGAARRERRLDGAILELDERAQQPVRAARDLSVPKSTSLSR